MHIKENVNFKPYLTTCTKINDLSEIINILVIQVSLELQCCAPESYALFSVASAV